MHRIYGYPVWEAFCRGLVRGHCAGPVRSPGVGTLCRTLCGTSCGVQARSLCGIPAIPMTLCGTLGELPVTMFGSKIRGASGNTLVPPILLEVFPSAFPCAGTYSAAVYPSHPSADFSIDFIQYNTVVVMHLLSSTVVTLVEMLLNNLVGCGSKLRDNTEAMIHKSFFNDLTQYTYTTFKRRDSVAVSSHHMTVKACRDCLGAEAKCITLTCSST